MRRRALGQRNERTFSIRRVLSSVVLLSQILFALLSISHVCAIGSGSGITAVVASEGAAIGASADGAAAHDPATCIICLAQNIDRGLAAAPPALRVTWVAESPTATVPTLSVPARRAALHQSRAPPSLT